MLWTTPARKLKNRLMQIVAILPYNTKGNAESAESEHGWLSLEEMGVLVDLNHVLTYLMA